ncbi:type II toxin-antitoxin system Phd/YefM family antitoxin [bacterium]|nr:type II toxin-antitoxin system Phd/YefM family antitoxin [bacterium]
MKRVTISELQADLPAYLDAVRSGQTVIVGDHETVVARIEPAGTADDLLVREPLITDPEERARVRRSIKPVVHLSKEAAKKAQAIIDDMRADRF